MSKISDQDDPFASFLPPGKGRSMDRSRKILALVGVDADPTTPLVGLPTGMFELDAALAAGAGCCGLTQGEMTLLVGESAATLSVALHTANNTIHKRDSVLFLDAGSFAKLPLFQQLVADLNLTVQAINIPNPLAPVALADGSFHLFQSTDPKKILQLWQISAATLVIMFGLGKHMMTDTPDWYQRFNDSVPAINRASRALGRTSLVYMGQTDRHESKGPAVFKTVPTCRLVLGQIPGTDTIKVLVDASNTGCVGNVAEITIP